VLWSQAHFVPFATHSAKLFGLDTVVGFGFLPSWAFWAFICAIDMIATADATKKSGDASTAISSDIPKTANAIPARTIVRIRSKKLRIELRDNAAFLMRRGIAIARRGVETVAIAVMGQKLGNAVLLLSHGRDAHDRMSALGSNAPLRERLFLAGKADIVRTPTAPKCQSLRRVNARQSPAPWLPAACCGCAACGRCRQ
jgi:hypothetical protein